MRLCEALRGSVGLWKGMVLTGDGFDRLLDGPVSGFSEDFLFLREKEEAGRPNVGPIRQNGEAPRDYSRSQADSGAQGNCHICDGSPIPYWVRFPFSRQKLKWQAALVSGTAPWSRLGPRKWDPPA